MELTLTRPALRDGLTVLGYDVDSLRHNEMRALVCAQCHSEYYFDKTLPGKKGVNYLVFPWKRGVKMEEIERYYDDIQFVDWVHQISRAPMLKAQHPDWELWQQGPHGERGVTCADCHMSYIAEGGVKFSDHQVRSPLAAINRTCQVCHRISEKEIRETVYSKQDRIATIRAEVETEIVKAHFDAKRAWEHGIAKPEMTPALQDIRHAQWRWDFVAASHGASFHASFEVARILTKAMAKAGSARLKLARLLARKGVTSAGRHPDHATQAAAQQLVGLDMAKLAAAKRRFKKTLLPDWQERAAKRQRQWDNKQTEVSH